MNARETEALERWRRLLAELPVAKLLGAEAIAWHEDGERAEMEFTAPAQFCNLMGNVQGGLLTAMLDMAMAFSVICAMEPGYVVPVARDPYQLHRTGEAGPHPRRGQAGAARAQHRLHGRKAHRSLRQAARDGDGHRTNSAQGMRA